jgi:ubiquitin-conjugating enzyme E2 G1
MNSKLNTILLKRYQNYIQEPIENLYFDNIDDNIKKWNFTLVGPKDTCWEDIVFSGNIEFPNTFPFTPPIVRIFNILHPNIYKDGTVCISILHDGVDNTGYELESERWTPIHSIQSIFLSIISLFHEPNCDSPANVDASILYRQDRYKFIKTARQMNTI